MAIASVKELPTDINVEKAVQKHFRRASIKVHPDRHGDTYQTEFDNLTKAKNVLCDAVLRAKYIEQMLDVCTKLGNHWMAPTHATWVRENRPDAEEQQPTTTTSRPQQEVRQLEGGLLTATPRKPTVAVLDPNDCLVRITFRMPGHSQSTWYEFVSHVTLIRIQAERIDLANVPVFCKELKDDALQEVLDSAETPQTGLTQSMTCKLRLSVQGLWQCTWQFGVSDHEMSPWSTATMVDMVTAKQKALVQAIEDFTKHAQKRESEIRSAVAKLTKSSTHHQKMDLETRRDLLHGTVLRAKRVAYHLEHALSKSGVATASPVLVSLRAALASAMGLMQSLAEETKTHEKKTGFKNFKKSIHERWDSGNGAAWIADVQESELTDELQGNANRLYQLLMEGKKAFNLELVDAATLEAAATRKDLFSSKQIEALAIRAHETSEREMQEARRQIEEEEKLKAEEEERRALEARGAGMDRGTFVQIIGLKSQPELNGTMATFMGLAKDDRFAVRTKDKKDIALKRENFRVWDDNASKAYKRMNAKKKIEPWSCKACTFLHDGENTVAVECLVCGLARNVENPHPAEKTVQKEEKDTKEPSKPKEKTVETNKESTKASTKVNKVKATISEPKEAPSKPQQAPKTPPRQAAATKKMNSPLVKPAATKPPPPKQAPAFEPIGGETILHMQPQPAQVFISLGPHIAMPQPPVAPPPAIAPIGTKSATTTPTPSVTKKPKRCRFGAKCKLLSKGNCKFHHTEEEIETCKVVPKVINNDVVENTLVPLGTAKLVIGAKGRTVKNIVSSTGAQIHVGDDNKALEGCPIRVSGPRASVDAALAQIQALVRTTTPSTQSSPSVPSVIVTNRDVVITPIPEDSTLLHFLFAQKAALKCSPDQFHARLLEQDICSLDDLGDACNDSDCVDMLVEAGLKKFKIKAFSKALAVVNGDA